MQQFDLQGIQKYVGKVRNGNSKKIMNFGIYPWKLRSETLCLLQLRYLQKRKVNILLFLVFILLSWK